MEPLEETGNCFVEQMYELTSNPLKITSGGAPSGCATRQAKDVPRIESEWGCFGQWDKWQGSDGKTNEEISHEVITNESAP